MTPKTIISGPASLSAVDLHIQLPAWGSFFPASVPSLFSDACPQTLPTDGSFSSFRSPLNYYLRKRHSQTTLSKSSSLHCYFSAPACSLRNTSHHLVVDLFRCLLICEAQALCLVHHYTPCPARDIGTADTG